MLRVLVLNDAVSVNESAGIVWGHMSGCVRGLKADELYAERASGVIDYDVFVVDTASLDFRAEAGKENITRRVAERIAAGGCLVCFLGTDARVAWIPTPSESHLEVRRVEAREIKTKEVYQTEWLAAALAEEPDFKVQIFQRMIGSWESLAWAKDGATVASTYRLNDGRVFLLPPMRRTRGSVVERILDKTIPKLLPNLGSVRVKGTELPPEWVATVRIPGADDMVAKVAAINAKLARLRELLATQEHHLEQRLSYQGLLWMSGFDLEEVVRASLRLLGIHVEPKPPIDAVCDLGGGHQLFIEIEGSEGPTSLKKGQQLLSYISDAADPTAVSGAIIANPYRKSPPDARPPAKAQAGLFVEPLQKLAGKQGWTLVTTTQLFTLVRRHFSGDKDAARQARRLLKLPEIEK